MEIKKDRVVTIDYTLRDDTGRLIDSSAGSEPLVYLHGNENIIPGLEKELEGKNPGEAIECSIKPGDAYGDRDEALVFKVQKKDFGENVEVAPGMQFEAHGENGVQIVTVVKVDGEEVTLDANHPLAGETLHFDVKVVDVREATPEELEHGHVHTGHDHEEFEEDEEDFEVEDSSES
ncbi:MAG: FKBP-type peptidyl-prolyl cis-trans isomerase [Spirochaetota bacterium]